MQEDVSNLAAFGVLTQSKHDGSVLCSPKCRPKLGDKPHSRLACAQQGNTGVLELFAWIELSCIEL